MEWAREWVPWLVPEDPRIVLRRQRLKLEQRQAELQAACDANLRTIDRKRHDIVTFARDGNRDAARRAALELVNTRNIYRRNGSLKDSLERVQAELQHQEARATTDDGLLLLCQVMGEHQARMNPERVSAMIDIYRHARQTEQSTTDAVNTFWSEVDEVDESLESETSAAQDRQIEAVFAEFNVSLNEPDVPSALDDLHPPATRP